MNAEIDLVMSVHSLHDKINDADEQIVYACTIRIITQYHIHVGLWHIRRQKTCNENKTSLVMLARNNLVPVVHIISTVI